MWRRLALACALITVATAVPSGVADAASKSGSIVFRCGANLCRVAPDGSARKRLTKNGRAGGPAYGWVSASRSGSRLGVSFGNKAYVLDGSGKRLRGPFRQGGAALVTQISPDGGKVATIELVPEVVSPVPTLSPYLYLQTAAGGGRDTVARASPLTGWLGRRLMRADRAPGSPFEQGICLLTSNAGFECERSVAAEAGRDLWGPATSPNRKLIAATRAPVDKVTGGIALYDAKTGRRRRTLTNASRDSQPSWSPDGKRIAFTRGRSIFVVAARGGRPRRVVAGAQPVWVKRAARRSGS